MDAKEGKEEVKRYFSANQPSWLQSQRIPQRYTNVLILFLIRFLSRLFFSLSIRCCSLSHGILRLSVRHRLLGHWYFAVQLVIHCKTIPLILCDYKHKQTQPFVDHPYRHIGGNNKFFPYHHSSRIFGPPTISRTLRRRSYLLDTDVEN